MKYSQIRRENELKEFRYFVLTVIEEFNLTNEQEFKIYKSMITKLYENDGYDRFEDVLEKYEEEALVNLTEFMIQIIDEEKITHIGSASQFKRLINCITAICDAKDYMDLGDSLISLNEMFE